MKWIQKIKKNTSGVSPRFEKSCGTHRMVEEPGKININFTQVLLLIISIILLLRLHLVLTRYFDIDETAHMHWAYLLSIGKLPYKDFFFYIIPFYQLFLLPVFLFTQSSFSLILSRIVEFIIYLLSLFILYKLANQIFTNKASKHLGGESDISSDAPPKVKKSAMTALINPISLLTLIIFLVFPMTFDKTIDIRPDVLMSLFLLLSLIFLNKIDNSPKTIPPINTSDGGSDVASDAPLGWRNLNRYKNTILSSVFYSLSFLTMPKAVFSIPAFLFLLVINYYKKPKFIALFIILFFIPVLIFFIYLLLTSNLSFAMTAILKNSFIVNQGKAPFSLQLALLPWPLIYIDRGGPSFPWIINCIIWVLSLLGLPFLYKYSKKMAVFISIIFISGIIYLYFFPVPYLQYFLPFTYFASLTAGLFIIKSTKILSKICVMHPFLKKYPWKSALQYPCKSILLSVFIIPLLISFFIQYQIRTSIINNNKEQLKVVADLTKISGKNETFYDMVGSYVIRPDGYFICCHPYQEFAHNLIPKPPNLRDSLVINNTKFTVLDRTGSVFWKALPEDLSFMFANYLPSKYHKIYTLGFRYVCDKGICRQMGLDNNPTSQNQTTNFNVIIDETYRIKTIPQGETVEIDGEKYSDNSIINLSKSLHSFSVSSSLTEFTIQLDR